MNKYRSRASRLCCIVLIASALAVAGSGTVFADPPDRHHNRGDRWVDRGVRWDDRAYPGEKRGQRGHSSYESRDSRRQHAPAYRNPKNYRDYRRPPRFFYHGKPYWAPPNRVRSYRDVVIVRPHGRWYPGFGHYHRDSDAYQWLALTAITLGILDNLSEQQQREYEAAQIKATTAPIGERINWRDGNASGSVVATREGASESGRYCREFQQQVTIGGRSEQAYGTACRNPDGSWEVVSGD